MNYVYSLSACFSLTGFLATEENARMLLTCDMNVALFLALAWALDRRKKA